jgi:hypothetical protein
MRDPANMIKQGHAPGDVILPSSRQTLYRQEAEVLLHTEPTRTQPGGLEMRIMVFFTTHTSLEALEMLPRLDP